MSTKIHQVYKNKNGIAVPGVTTILGMLDKPALLHWAWDLGIKGEDYRKVRDKAGNIGTIAHYLIECHVNKLEPDLSEYSPKNVETAQMAFEAYLEFAAKNDVVIISTEMQLVSNKYNYGGTIDCYCKLNGKYALLDFKTSSGLYPEMRCQVSAYENLLLENGYPVEEVHLLRIDKEKGEFHHHRIDNTKKEWTLFKLLAKAYPLKKAIWGQR